MEEGLASILLPRYTRLAFMGLMVMATDQMFLMKVYGNAYIVQMQVVDKTTGLLFHVFKVSSVVVQVSVVAFLWGS